MPPSQRIHIPTLLAIVLIASVFRAVIAQGESCISRDGVWFVAMARKLADDPVRHMRIETKQPGYAWILLAAHSIIGDDTPESWQATGTVLAGIGGVAVCAWVYVLALRLFGRTVAAVAGLFAAFWPQGAHLSADVLSDMPHLAMYLGAMLLSASTAGRAVFARWAAAGALLGAAFWLRLEAIGLVPAAAIWAFATNPSGAWRRALALGMTFGIAFAMIAGPFVWLARMGEPSGTVESAISLVQTVGTSHDSVAMEAAPVFANAVPTAQLPGRIAEEWAKSGRYIFAVLFLAALFLRSMPRAARPLAILCGIAAAFQIALVAARVLRYGELSSRYLLVPVALTIPWAAAALVHLVQLAIDKSSDTSRYKFIPIWASGLMLTLFPLIFFAIQSVDVGRLTLREAGQWLRANAPAADVILADDQNLTQVQYYADRIYPNTSKWERLERDAGSEVRGEAVSRIRPAWFVSMVDSPDELVDAEAHAKSLCESLGGYETARIFDNGPRPVIVLRRVAP